MGGLGSGRRSGSGRSIIESCRALDVNRLHREGCLCPGQLGGWQWTRDGKPIASIQLRAEQRGLHLSYRVCVGGEWTSVEETIEVVHRACRLGGSRPYLICPGVVNGTACRRRVAKLYGAGRYFLCRHCYRLAYASQSEDLLDRTRRRADKIRRRLSGEPGVWLPFPERPKGMWNRTYTRLRSKVIEAEVKAEDLFGTKAEQLLGRLDRHHGKGRFWR